MASPHAHGASTATIVLPPRLPRMAGAANAQELAAPAEASASLPLGQISTLLWAGTAFRPHGHRRAALPPCMQPPVVLYAVLPEGTYRYDPADHSLVLVTSEDLRRWLGGHGAVRSVLDLLYVDGGSPEDEGEWEECGTLAGADATQVARNVAAYCSCAGLVATVARRVPPQLRKALALAAPQRIALVQRVGHPSAGPH